MVQKSRNKVFTTLSGEKVFIIYIFLDNIDKYFTVFDSQT